MQVKPSNLSYIFAQICINKNLEIHQQAQIFGRHHRRKIYSHFVYEMSDLHGLQHLYFIVRILRLLHTAHTETLGQFSTSYYLS